MSQPIDVGSVLGGRYKVTATVLTSHDQDLVLDGVDQVLNRPVSILVAGPGNGDQVAQSAREVATGERPGSVQVLDLGVSEEHTYLITNHTSAPDLLDLVVASNPPYVEPFFTDTLGSEIFGQPRSTEPEVYGEDNGVDAGFITYDDQYPSQVDPYPASSAAEPVQPPTRTDAPHESDSTAPQTVHSGRPSGEPKVSLWSEDDYRSDSSRDVPSWEDQTPEEPASKNRAAAAFPLLARKGTPAAASEPADTPDIDDDGDGEEAREPRSMRWLVGGILAVVLVGGLVFAVNGLGSITTASDQSADPVVTEPAPAPPSTTAPSPSPSETTAPPAVAPVIDTVTRQGAFDFAAGYDGDLAKAFDGNTASYWSDMEFATENWGGLAPEGVPLVVKLKEPSRVSSVTLTQLGASGGNVSIFTNSKPSLDGAKQLGNSGFTGTELTVPAAEPETAEYVIVSIKTLPKLAVPKTRYGFGLRLAEITVQ